MKLPVRLQLSSVRATDKCRTEPKVGEKETATEETRMAENQKRMYKQEEYRTAKTGKEHTRAYNSTKEHRKHRNSADLILTSTQS